MITLRTDLKRLTSDDLGYLEIFLDCAPRGKVKKPTINAYANQSRTHPQTHAQRPAVTHRNLTTDQ